MKNLVINNRGVPKLIAKDYSMPEDTKEVYYKALANKEKKNNNEEG